MLKINKVILDTSVTNYLEEFNDAEDAIIYIYRLGGVLGAAAKWTIVVDKKKAAKLGMNDFTLVHINTAVKNHSVMYSKYSAELYQFQAKSVLYDSIQRGGCEIVLS